MARGGEVLEIDRRDPPDPGQLLRERPLASHRRAVSERSHRRNETVLECSCGPALNRMVVQQPLYKAAYWNDLGSWDRQVLDFSKQSGIRIRSRGTPRQGDHGKARRESSWRGH